MDFRFISKHSGFPLQIIILPLFHINFSSCGWKAGPLEDAVHRRQPRTTENIRTDALFFIFIQAHMDVIWFFFFAGYCAVRSVPKVYKIISDNLDGR